MLRDPQAHWLEPATALHYARAAVRVGLWTSERLVIRQYLQPHQRILELGCGGGRVALGLLHLGFTQLKVTDFSSTMVEQAQSVLGEVDERWAQLVEQQDATALTYPDASFEAALFAFNGLMCLPSRAHRLAALHSIHRVLNPGGIFIFTAPDREQGACAAYWAQEPDTDEPSSMMAGDRWHESETSPVFMHSSTESETRAELAAGGFELLACPLSTAVADDGPAVHTFAGETRFYVARKA